MLLKHPVVDSSSQWSIRFLGLIAKSITRYSSVYFKGGNIYRAADSACFPIESATGDFSHEAVIIEVCYAFIEKRLIAKGFRHMKFMRKKLSFSE